MTLPAVLKGSQGMLRDARRGAVAKGCAIGAGVVLVLIGVVVMFLWGGYNGLVSAEEDARLRAEIDRRAREELGGEERA